MLELTKSQQLLWAGQQLHPETPLYNMTFAFRIEGALQPDLFSRAFAAVVAECDALRTVFETRDGVPTRRVGLEVPAHLTIKDFSDREVDAEQWMQSRCSKMFKLNECLFDSALLRTAPNRWIWFLNQHHLICDAWSVAILFQRVAVRYERMRDGDDELLDPMSSFETYASLEHDLHSQAGQVEYWENIRKNTPAAPSLYGSREREASTASDRLSVTLGPDRVKGLLDLIKREGFRTLTRDLGLFQVFATTVFAWMARVGGQQELAISAPSHNRATSDLRATVGLLTEVFPLLAQVDEDDSFASLYEKVRVSTSSFLRFASPGVSDARYTRPCNVILNFVRGSFGAFAGQPVRVEWLHPGHHDQEHHARVHVHDFDGGDRWQVQFDLSRDRFGPQRAQRAVDHFVRLLDAFLEDPQQSVFDPDLLSQNEYAELRAFNATSSPLVTQTVLDTFEAIAASSPDAAAVRCGEQVLSYRELGLRAETIAARLGLWCARRGQRIGIMRGRSIETVATILGVMKTGATYVPIDPTWPKARISFVLEDAGISLVLTETGCRVELPDGVRSLSTEDVDTEGASVDTESRPSLGDCAYVMYTSGSTGKPKGVVIEHSALANYVAWAREKYTVGNPLSFPLFSPLTFDLTITSLFVPLTSGGTIVVYPETAGQADFALLDVVNEDQVDIIKLTPSHLRLLEDRDLTGSRARQLILGGESLTAEAVARIARTFGDNALVHNEYGPTEATVGCVVHSFSAGTHFVGAAPIGRPLANLRAWILDGHGNPVPDGAVGELCVGGAGLARGYLGQADRTAERFVPCRLDPDGRVYRTGDLARRNQDGDLEYFGRNDLQLKIRGARVEPGEIEAALTDHPQVATCVVSAFQSARPDTEPVTNCVRCGLPSTYPDANIDHQDVCQLCRSFDGYGDRAQKYFRTLDDLRALFEAAPRAPEYDCLALFSGGKDSSYMLCRLVDLGLRVFAFTLDNGYISDQAKANIRRVVDHLEVPHIFARTPAMNEIFVDSLERHANVCQGCFKTIYTLAIQHARRERIPFVVTGLSRGQLFETRLTEELWTDPGLDPENIDDIVLQARKAYHRVDDAASRLLDNSIFQDDQIFGQVQVLDFYRYTDVGLEEMLAYLRERVPWVRPSDTGRSTNCLINDVGIFVHRRQRGYHNYALPYSWDVRLGHKNRDAALAELDDEIDPKRVHAILDEIGYRNGAEVGDDLRLVAYYEAEEALPESALKEHLASRLPSFLVPSHYVRVESIPLTPNGKVDRSALPNPGAQERRSSEDYVAPRSAVETTLTRLWADALRVDRVGIRDDFFKLGGDSILAIQIVARAHKAGLRLSPADLFEALTVEKLAAQCGESDGLAQAGPSTGPVLLTPGQAWLLEDAVAETSHWNHVVRVRFREPVSLEHLRSGLGLLVERHDALRLSFHHEEGEWRANCNEVANAPELLVASDLSFARGQIDRPFDLANAPLFRAAARVEDDEARELLLVAHHLVVDAVSWSLLLEDLTSLLRAVAAETTPAPRATMATLVRWGETVASDASGKALEELPYWRSALAVPVEQLPLAIRAETGDLVANQDMVTMRLDVDTSRALLEEVPASGRIRVQEVMLAAFAKTLAEWSGNRKVRLWLEGLGREAIHNDVDVVRTVGWFSSLFPITIGLPSATDFASLLREVKEQLRAVPRRGFGYGALRYAGPPHIREELAKLERPDVLFNYLGDVDRLLSANDMFTPLAPLELSRAPKETRRFPLVVTAFVRNEQLVAEWAYASDKLSASEARFRAERFVHHLRGLVNDCCARPDGTASASDFPLARLDEQKLTKVAAALQLADAEAPRGPGD